MQQVNHQVLKEIKKERNTGTVKVILVNLAKPHTVAITVDDVHLRISVQPPLPPPPIYRDGHLRRVKRARHMR